MLEIPTTCLLFLAASIAALAAPNADRDAVARIDRIYQDAVKRNDANAMKQILHPKFQLVLGDGRRFGREELLDDDAFSLSLGNALDAGVEDGLTNAAC